ncbi:hypothetical protein K435DRAFT_804874 [Dendrothele bispora CBS 962.96]|uniref:Uncharacterized protein n=1 Tax=Dendrothele bispora (strain CBS 962.96) TaxID=1314807 RepID=A0A4S8LD06_DENBC|nr:hypothetical protein K435DRAFT_804874 [Dendrothele bispora CBS 962.96]
MLRGNWLVTFLNVLLNMFLANVWSGQNFLALDLDLEVWSTSQLAPGFGPVGPGPLGLVQGQTRYLWKYAKSAKQSAEIGPDQQILVTKLLCPNSRQQDDNSQGPWSKLSFRHHKHNFIRRVHLLKTLSPQVLYAQYLSSSAVFYKVDHEEYDNDERRS